MLLREFILHAADGGANEEGNEVLVSATCTDLLEGSDVGSSQIPHPALSSRR